MRECKVLIGWITLHKAYEQVRAKKQTASATRPARSNRISVRFELPSEREVATDRAMEAWYHPSIA